MTNYEWIKSLSIEDMVRWLRSLHFERRTSVFQYCTKKDCLHCSYDGSPGNNKCIDKCIMDWLNQSEEENEDGNH